MTFRWGFVLPLAFAQLVSWGSLYYAFAVIAGPMAAEMGWSSPAINGALSAGLAATGFASFFVGRAIDVYGGRVLMTAGSTAAALMSDTLIPISSSDFARLVSFPSKEKQIK